MIKGYCDDRFLKIKNIFSNQINNNANVLDFKQIKTNISKFIGEEQFRKSRIHDFDWLEGGWFSIKDVNIYEDKIYVS